MRNEISNKTAIPTQRRVARFMLAALFAVAAGAAGTATAHHGGQQARPDQYRQTNLVSDLPGAAVQDPALVNAWGISFSPTSPFWVSANESGRSMIYSVTNDSHGVTYVTKQSLEVTIPGEGNVTGQVFNNTSGFNSNVFLFVSEDGTISGWRPALGTAAETLTMRPGAVYKGVALAMSGRHPILLAANFAEGTLDVYDQNLVLLNQYSDPLAPDGYAPFNVQVIKGLIFVTFAKQDDEKEDDVPGPGNGLIDVFIPQNGRFHRFATGSSAGGKLTALNSPWGLALAPASFGSHADELLVGNFGSGTIMAFTADGNFRGFLNDENNHPITIEGLWALTFGNGGRAGRPGTLYFTAGPGGETHGLFGSLSLIKNRDHGSNGDNGNDNDDDDDDN